MNTMIEMIQHHRQEALSLAQDLPEPYRTQAQLALAESNWFPLWGDIIQQYLATQEAQQ